MCARVRARRDVCYTHAIKSECHTGQTDRTIQRADRDTRDGQTNYLNSEEAQRAKHRAESTMCRRRSQILRHQDRAETRQTGALRCMSKT